MGTKTRKTAKLISLVDIPTGTYFKAELDVHNNGNLTKVIGQIQREDYGIYLCHNNNIVNGSYCHDKLGYSYSWNIGSGRVDCLRDADVKSIRLFKTKPKDLVLPENGFLFDGTKVKRITPNITYKSVLEGLTVNQRNEYFNSLDPEGQRLEIAWDALQLVTKGILKSSRTNGGSDSHYWSEKLLSMGKEKGSCGLQKDLLRLTPKTANSCTVCQRGLMMVSQIRIGNEISPLDSDRYQGTSDNLKGFDIIDMQAMEREYEYSAYNLPYREGTEEKLANICCNVLINGNFNPFDKTDYLIVKFVRPRKYKLKVVEKGK